MTTRPPVVWAPVARPELPSLQGIADADERLFLRFRLRSNVESDQEIARARCLAWGVEYEQARDEAQRS